MGRADPRIALALPFAWIGVVGAWFLAKLAHLPEHDHASLLPLLLVTPVTAGAFGWLLASPRLDATTREIAPLNNVARNVAFVLGTPLAGILNGIVVATVVACENVRDGSMGGMAPMFGAIGGGICGVLYLPALLPVFVAHARAGRARKRSVIQASDRRAVAVAAAGVGALAMWICPDYPDAHLVSRWIMAAAFVVGLFGLFMDGLTYARLRKVMRELRDLVPLEGGSSGPVADRVIDFGLGEERSQVLAPARVAYRDVPRCAILVRGRPDAARRSLRFALALDALTAAFGAWLIVAS